MDQALLRCWLLFAAPGGRALWLPWWNLLHTYVHVRTKVDMYIFTWACYAVLYIYSASCNIYTYVYTHVCVYVCTKVCKCVCVSPTRTWTAGCDCAFCSLADVSFSFSFTSYTEAETAVAVITYHTYVHTYVRMSPSTLSNVLYVHVHTHTAKAQHSRLTHLVLAFWLFIRPRPLPLSLSTFLAVLSPAREPPVFILPGLPAASSGEASWHRDRERRKHECVYIRTYVCTNVQMSTLRINADRIVRSQLLIC